MALSDTALNPLQLRSSCRERRHWSAMCIEAGAAIKARSNGICWLTFRFASQQTLFGRLFYRESEVSVAVRVFDNRVASLEVLISSLRLTGNDYSEHYAFLRTCVPSSHMTEQHPYKSPTVMPITVRLWTLERCRNTSDWPVPVRALAAVFP